eukprot:Skav224430  [mRNA]  locus=scaffold657:635485:639051:+ [translate_table: standard]
MSPNAVSLRGTLAQEANRIRLWYGDRPLFPDKCPHDTTRFVSIRISMSQWTHVVQHTTSFVLVNAKVTAAFRMHLDTTDGLSSATTLRMARDELGWSMINTVELFAGGFSGWTHAVRSLSSEGFAFNQFLALDHDLDCAESYMASHPVDTRVGPGDFSWTEDDLPGSMFVVCELLQLNWIHLIGVLPIHMLLMSPPCPAWSLATNRAGGLDREDGQVMLEVWGALSLLRPKVIDMENVATLMSHHHWPQIQEFINWCGFQVRWSVTLNLNQVLPQNRDRMLLIATCYEDDSLQLHTCIGWPVYAPPTIDDSFIFMPNVEPWISQVRLSDELVKLYLDPASLPRKAIAGLDSQHKRTKLDVLSYRCKFGPDVATCIMANYGFAHELPSHTLQAGGLYGCVVIREDGIRFFQPHEVALLMGATQDVWLPLEAKKALKLMGNAIAVPHASIALRNSLAFFNADLTPNEVTALFVELFGHRHTASEVSLVHLFLIMIKSLSLSGDSANLTCRFKLFGTWVWRGEIDAQANLRPISQIWHSLRAIVGDTLGIRFLFQGQIIGASAPLASFLDPSDMLDASMDITLVPGQHGGGPVELRPNNRFAPESDPGVSSLATSSKASAPAPVVMPEDVSTQDIRRVVSRTRSLAAIEEESFSEGMKALFQMWHELPSQERILEPSSLLEVQTFVEDGMLVFQDDLENIFPMNRVFKFTGMELALDRAGWKVSVQFVQFGRPAKARLLVFPSPVGESMSIRAVREFIRACFVTFCFPKPVRESRKSALIRAKLWGVRFFEGFLKLDAPMSDMYDAWDQASSFVGDPMPYRIVALGKLTIQENLMRDYIPADKPRDSHTTFVFMPPQHGGGPAVSDAIVRTKNQLATLLINAGAHLEDLTPFVDKMFTQVGHVAIQQALGTKPAADKWKALRQMASGASIEFPTLSPKERDAGKRIKDKLAQLKKDQQDQLIPNLLTLQEGFFVNMDGSNSTQLDRLQPNACGVVIMTPKEAEPWISANQKISPDELAILVLGHCLCDDRSKCKVTNVPMFNKAGFPIIVQGVLHQMGQVPIEVSSDTDVQIQVGDSTVISVTTFRDELDPAKWVEVTQKPIRTCLLLLLGIDDKLDLASPPWGRNFAKGKARSDPSSATSFQFHIRVNASDVSRVLKASGTNGVYTVPKTDTHLVSDKYQIIWVQLPRAS